MTYVAPITRVNPTCAMIVIDQSGSMGDAWGYAGGESDGAQAETKSEVLATITNNYLSGIVLKCTMGEEVRDYLHVGVIGYGERVGAALSGPLAGQDLVPLSMVADNPTRIEDRTKTIPDGAGGLVEQQVRFPVWFDPKASNGTPMTQAMSEAYRILSNWLQDPDHADCFPPALIHITDGESTDGDPTGVMNDIKDLRSSDGSVILFNVHLSSTQGERRIEYPSSGSELPDEYAKMLFETSSLLAPHMIDTAKDFGYSLVDDSKAYVYQADQVRVIQALDIGTPVIGADMDR